MVVLKKSKFGKVAPAKFGRPRATFGLGSFEKVVGSFEKNRSLGKLPLQNSVVHVNLLLGSFENACMSGLMQTELLHGSLENIAAMRSF